MGKGTEGLNVQSFILSLLACSISMSALALFYIIIDPLLARYSAKTRYYVWLIVILGLIIPYRPQLNNSAAIRLSLPKEITLTVAQPPENTEEKVSAPAPAAARAGLPSIWQAAFTIWLFGCVLSFSYQLFRHYKFLKVIMRWGSAVADEKILALLQELKTDMVIEKEIGLYYCPAAGSPMLTGFLRPRIILPNIDFKTEELCLILRHEFVHFKRKDLYYKNLVLIAASVHWFNPFVLMVAKAINTLCEISCDYETLQNSSLDTRLSYSETILSVVGRQSKLMTFLSTNFYGGKKDMKKRISSIMDTTRKRIGGMVLLAAVICTVGTGSVFALSTMNADKITIEPSAAYNAYYSRMKQRPRAAELADEITFTDMSAWWDTGWGDDEFILSYFMEGYSEISEYGIKCWDESGKEISYIDGPTHEVEKAQANGYFCIEAISPDDGSFYHGLEVGKTYSWIAYAVRDGERIESPVQTFVFSTEGTRFAK
jgi:beta-lactamase regulating signal transducer with metallopeptidase domain